MCRFSKIAKNDKSLHPTIQTVHAQSGGGSGGHPAGLAGGGGHPAGLGGGPAAGQGGSTDKKNIFSWVLNCVQSVQYTVQYTIVYFSN